MLTAPACLSEHTGSLMYAHVQRVLHHSAMQMKGRLKSMLNSSAGTTSRRNSAAAAAAAVAANPEAAEGAESGAAVATNPLFDDPHRNNPLYDPTGGPENARGPDAAYFAPESLPVIRPRPRELQALNPQLPSLLNQPPLPPPPSFPSRPVPLGATRLSVGSSASQPPPLQQPQPPPQQPQVSATSPAVEPYNSSFGVSFAAPSAFAGASAAVQLAGNGPSAAAAAAPTGSVQLADIQAMQTPPAPPQGLQTLQTSAPQGLQAVRTLAQPPNLASLPPHVLRDYSPIKRAGSAGSVGSEVPLLGRVDTSISTLQPKNALQPSDLQSSLL